MNQSEPTSSELLSAIENLGSNLRAEIAVSADGLRGEIANLTITLQAHMETTEQRFDGVDQRLDGIDQRLESVDQRFDAVDQRLDGVDHRLESIDQRFDGIDQQFKEVFEILEALPVHMDEQTKAIKSEMATKADLQRFATKEYLDDKLGSLRDDLMVMARTSNRKFEALIKDLVSEKRLHPTAARRILLLEPLR